MEPEEYLRLINRGFALAFTAGAVREGAACYAEALGSLAPGELAYADHHAEYATALMALGQGDEAVREGARAIESAERAASGCETPEVALHRCVHAERLLALGRPEEALAAIQSIRSQAGAVASAVAIARANALSALGRLREARQVAVDAWKDAAPDDRAVVRERLGPLLGDTPAG